MKTIKTILLTALFLTLSLSTEASAFWFRSPYTSYAPYAYYTPYTYYSVVRPIYVQPRIYAPAPVYYAPAPVYYAPAPVYVPAPAYYYYPGAVVGY
jgi:hypothetical protein